VCVWGGKSQNTLLRAYYLNVCVMIRFELKLQVKFRNNKNYSNVIVNFPHRLMLKKKTVTYN